MAESKDCLFCKIARHEIPAGIVHEDDQLVAFKDINPQAPVHYLIIPKSHIPTVSDLETADSEVVGRVFLLAKELARRAGISDSGYRVVVNCGEGAGQSVFHIHFHLLGGRSLGWPPG